MMDHKFHLIKLGNSSYINGKTYNSLTGAILKQLKFRIKSSSSHGKRWMGLLANQDRIKQSTKVLSRF